MKNNQRQKGNAVVIVVLVVALVAMGALWYNEHRTVRALTEENPGTLDAYQSALVTTCTMTATSTNEQRALCRQTLQELAGILESYKDMLETRTTSTTNVATTTTATSSASSTATTSTSTLGATSSAATTR